MAKYTPKPYTRGRSADDQDYEDNQERFTRPQAKPRAPEQPRFDYTGQRIPPLARGWKRGSCTWVPAIGWVFNPEWKVLG